MAETHKRGGLSIEYAKSGRAGCKCCDGTIKQDSMRIGKEVPSDYHDGYDLQWYHYACCNKKSGAPKFDKIIDVRDWEYLRWDDQLKIKKDLGEKIEDNEEEKRREKENKAIWDLIDDLDGKVKGPQLKAILEANGMEVKKMTPSRMLIKVADGMLFGLISPCPECKYAGSLRYNGIEYYCKNGWISAFTRCEFRGTKGVVREKFNIPADIKKLPFFKDWKPPKGFEPPTSTSSGERGKQEEAEQEEEKEEVDDGTPEEDVPDGLEMWGMGVVIAGTKKDLGVAPSELEELIMNHGGEVYDEAGDGVHFLVAPESELNKKKKTKKVTSAVKAGIPVLSAEYVQNLCGRKEEGIKLRQKEVAKTYLVGDSEMGDTPLARKYTKAKYEKEQAKKEKADKEEEEEEEEPKERVIKRKRAEPKAGSDILKIDPDSGLATKGEILVTQDDRYGYTTYNVMLNVSDTATGANKYYKMQIIKTKGKNVWTFFIKYGRIGTDVGDHKNYEKRSENSAIQQFIEKYEEKSGVKWENRDIFEKKPGKYFMVDIDDGNEDPEDAAEEEDRKKKRQKKEEETVAMDTDTSKEEMPKRLQDFIRTIFDQKMMQKTLESMNVDVKKMPLGKIKKTQIKDGYKVLTEIQNLLESKEEPEKMKTRIKDCTNRFYTLIPHDFGRGTIPLIQDIEDVKKKMNLLDTLTDLEVASSLMKETVDENDPVLQNYKSLKAKIAPLEKDSERYKLLESYALNTHDTKYFSNFTFTVDDIFEIEREGERKKFDSWKDNQNRLLLWHGSRLTNWVGIISQGLRIAPPEAPKTGYRFGKGVYFADVISKSGSYCFTSNDNPTGVMLLAEVAIGKPAELLQDEYMEKPKSGTNSTKALGQAAPNPKEYEKIEGCVVPEAKVTVPRGSVIDTKIRSACSHNEYIIYDVSQITVRYLLKLNFKHKVHSW